MMSTNGSTQQTGGSTGAVRLAYDEYVFDLDGTIYLGDKLLPGARELIHLIRRSGRQCKFLTNNSTRTREDYAAKLTTLGISAVAEDVVTSATVAASWLRAHHPEVVCFPVGEPPLWEALVGAGIRVSQDPAEITMVLASYDRTFDYGKLRTAFRALWRRPEAILMATHPDQYCPLPNGCGEPDAAAITAAIEACSGRSCQVVLGKPSVDTLRAVLDATAIPVERSIVVGDRIPTDIAMGATAGAATALVLTGDSTVEDAKDAPPEHRPTYVLAHLDALAAPLNLEEETR